MSHVNLSAVPEPPHGSLRVGVRCILKDKVLAILQPSHSHCCFPDLGPHPGCCNSWPFCLQFLLRCCQSDLPKGLLLPCPSPVHSLQGYNQDCYNQVIKASFLWPTHRYFHSPCLGSFLGCHDAYRFGKLIQLSTPSDAADRPARRGWEPPLPPRLQRGWAETAPMLNP